MSDQQPDQNLFSRVIDFLDNTLGRILDSSQWKPWKIFLSVFALILVASMLWKGLGFDSKPNPNSSTSPSPTVISQDVLQEACKRYADEHRGYLLSHAENGRVQDFELSGISDGDLGVARCKYKIMKQDGNISQKNEEIRVKLKPQFDDLVTGNIYRETKIPLQEVCQTEKTYAEVEKENLSKGGRIKEPKLALADNLNNVWPVFRWVCLYSVTFDKKLTSQNGKGYGLENQERRVGMNLDRFCEDNYPGQKKATHHNYQDPWSLYCT